MICGCPEHFLAEAAAGRAQWPTSCMALLYYVDNSGLRGLTKDEFYSTVDQCCDNITNVSGLRIKRTLDWGAADIQMRGEPMSSGTLGYAYFPTNSCGEKLQVRLNSNVNWSAPLYKDTTTHELGHAFGLDHVTGVSDIMNPSIDLGAGHDGQFGPHYSIPEMITRYGESDAPGPAPDPPTPEPPEVPPMPTPPQLPWDILSEILRDLIERFGCARNPDVSQFRRPNRRVRRALEWRIRHQLRLPFRQQRELMRDLYTDMANLEDWEIAEILEDVR